MSIPGYLTRVKEGVSGIRGYWKNMMELGLCSINCIPDYAERFLQQLNEGVDSEDPLIELLAQAREDLNDTDYSELERITLILLDKASLPDEKFELLVKTIGL